MASAKETLACLDVAEAVGYLPMPELLLERDRLDRIIAILWKLIHRPRR